MLITVNHMTYTPQEIDEIIQSRNSTECTNLEFKEAKNNFDSRDRSDYCAGIANAGGGKMLLGIKNDGTIVGTSVYKGTIQKIPHELYQELKIWIDVEEVNHSEGRVVIFTIPTRPPAKRILSKGKYAFPTRKGESLVEMDDETSRSVLNETQSDYTAETIHDLNFFDLKPEAIDFFRKEWAKVSGNKNYLNHSDKEILVAAALLTGKHLTRAALILFGSEKALRNHLSCCEIIFEWRQDPNKISYDFRQEWRDAFFLICDDIWEKISARNIRFPISNRYQENGIMAFNRDVMREAILNAVTHRDYHSSASIFIKASPETLRIESPGGFLAGITPENIIKKSNPRNRLLAEIFQHIKFVERSGQGIDKIFRACIEEGKGLPDFLDSDDFQVALNVPAVLRDAAFVNFLNEITKKDDVEFSIDEILELEKIRLENGLRQISNKKKFIDLGIVEKISHGRGTRYILSHNYYKQTGRAVIYTKIIGISRNTIKEQILNHIKKNGKIVAREIRDGFSHLSQVDVQNILQELKKSQKINCVGIRGGAYWVLNSSGI